MEGWSSLIMVPGLLFIASCITAVGGKSSGGWGEWGGLSQCTKTCGMGLRQRLRTWVPGPGEPPLEKPFTNTEEFTCLLVYCPQDGSWSSWGMWAGCSVACGNGTRQRTRDCNSPPPQNGGKPCAGSNMRIGNCTNDPCPPTPPNFDMSKCDPDQNFTCDNKRMCVEAGQRCDGVVQCSDGTDEMGCRRRYKIGHVHFVHGGGKANALHAGKVTLSMVALVSLFCSRGAHWWR